MEETIFKRWGRELTIAGAIVLFLLPLIGIPGKTYITLTIAGFAMGMLLFLVASGVSIIFGLMDVLNFAHGALFAWGAYVGFTVFGYLMKWVEADSVLQNFAAFSLAIVAAMIVVALVGIVLERVIVRRVYGSHLFQILITFGATIVLVELIRVFWGPNDEVMTVPLTFSRSWDVMDIIINKYRVICIVVGLVVYGVIQLILKKTKLGMIVRAGVEDRDMVQGGPGGIRHVHIQFAGVSGHGRLLPPLCLHRCHHRGPGKHNGFPRGCPYRWAHL